MSETWLPVVGWEDSYEVSDRGRVRSLDRIIERPTKGLFFKAGRILKHGINTHGRHQVFLCADGRRERLQVHRLVLAAFIGPCPNGLVALHWDDDPNNNRLPNLRYGTMSENQYDRVRNGNHYKANQTHCIHGHEYTAENTYRSRHGRRKCKTCSFDRYYARRSA